MKRIYADNSATTQVRQESIDAIVQVLKNDFGNPSSIHTDGRKAKAYLNIARENIASLINSNPKEIIFTSGGTESNNLLISGIANSAEKNILLKDKHIITSAIEHSAIKEPLEALEKRGWKVDWLNVNREGLININELKSAINKSTALVSIIHGNNEIGTIQDITEIASICNKHNVLFHSDATQTFGKIPIDLQINSIDFMSFSSHKIYGPKGVGGLYVKTGNEKYVTPLFYGGGQELSIRPGTENLPGIVGFGIAAKLLHEEMNDNIEKLLLLQKKLISALSHIEELLFTGIQINNDTKLNRLPGHVSFCIKDIDGESLVLQLDLKGISVSSGSACSSSKSKKDKIEIIPSHVISALGISENYTKGSIRVSFGKNNTEEDIVTIANSIKDIINKLNKASIN